MQPNPYYNKGLSQSLYNSSYVPNRSYDDYTYSATGKIPAKDNGYLQNRGQYYQDDYLASNKQAAYQNRGQYYTDDYLDVGNKQASFQNRGQYYSEDYLGAANKPAGKVWSDYIPIEKRYLDYVPQQKIEYMPVERNYTDYLEVEHQLDYVPVPKLNKHIEYIPVEKYDQTVDYFPYEKSYVRSMGGEGPQVNPPPNTQGGYYNTSGSQGYYNSPNQGYYSAQNQGYPNGAAAGQGYYKNHSQGVYNSNQQQGIYGNRNRYSEPQSQYSAGQYGYAPQTRPQAGTNYARDGYWQNKY